MPKRRDVFKLPALLGPMALFAAKPGELQNIVVDASKVRTNKAPFGELKIFFDGPTEQLKTMTAGSLLLYANQEPHPPHEHPEEEFMVITEGTGELMVDGKTYKVGPGSMMYCAANKSHGIKAGSKNLLFYFYKWKA
jgi:mannose-6-phosphate isomerase-like protein (cupin superfamily)